MAKWKDEPREKADSPAEPPAGHDERPVPVPVQAPVPAPAAAPPPGEGRTGEAELQALRAEVARLRAAQVSPPTGAANKSPAAFGTQPLHAEAQTAPAGPALPDRRHAVGAEGPGKRLWLVSLPGHKSRVVDPQRGVAVLLQELPVWASGPGEAQTVFAGYNGVVSTAQQYRVVPME